VYILRSYNQKHPKHLKNWDEITIYIQYSYNRSIQTSISKSPFGNFFGYFPPLPLDVVYGKKRGMKEDITGEALREEKFIEILHISICKYKRH
jgi:hypothetical protein